MKRRKLYHPPSTARDSETQRGWDKEFEQKHAKLAKKK